MFDVSPIPGINRIGTILKIPHFIFSSYRCSSSKKGGKLCDKLLLGWKCLTCLQNQITGVRMLTNSNPFFNPGLRSWIIPWISKSCRVTTWYYGKLGVMGIGLRNVRIQRLKVQNKYIQYVNTQSAIYDAMNVAISQLPSWIYGENVRQSLTPALQGHIMESLHIT
jgi:hypothetical protein